MARDNVEGFLAVKWHDGLMVRSDHFLHTDARVSALFSEAVKVFFDQPGLAQIRSDATVSSQLVGIENVRPKGEGETLEITLNVLSPFLGLTPDGGIVVGIPNTKGSLAMPATAVKVEIQSGKRADYLLCAKQKTNEELNIRKICAEDRVIELSYPGLQVDAVTAERYKSLISTEYANCVPVALLRAEEDEAEIAPSYIPPVTRLRLADFFQRGAVTSLAQLLLRLSDVSSEYIGAGGYLFSREEVGVEVRTRYYNYHLLNALLLAKSGMVRDLSEFSPVRFFHELMFPLARWFDQYYGTLKERKSSMAPLATASSRIRELSGTDLFAGTETILALSNDFVFKIIEAIKEIG